MAANEGNFFEDFHVGQVIRHATPRTVTSGDTALYGALYGSRFAVQSSEAFARAIGYRHAPADDLLVFNIVFGKSVPDISLNAIANLGYAAGRLLAPVYPGDTLHAVSEVIGLRENSDGKAGVVYVRSTGLKQDGTEVVDFVRWVMVRKRDEASAAPEANVPKLPSSLHADGNRLDAAVDGDDDRRVGCRGHRAWQAPRRPTQRGQSAHRCEYARRRPPRAPAHGAAHRNAQASCERRTLIAPPDSLSSSSGMACMYSSLTVTLAMGMKRRPTR
jgi:acyl dehydratase